MRSLSLRRSDSIVAVRVMYMYTKIDASVAFFTTGACSVITLFFLFH